MITSVDIKRDKRLKAPGFPNGNTPISIVVHTDGNEFYDSTTHHASHALAPSKDIVFRRKDILKLLHVDAEQTLPHGKLHTTSIGSGPHRLGTRKAINMMRRHTKRTLADAIKRATREEHIYSVMGA